YHVPALDRTGALAGDPGPAGGGRDCGTAGGAAGAPRARATGVVRGGRPGAGDLGRPDLAGTGRLKPRQSPAWLQTRSAGSVPLTPTPAVTGSPPRPGQPQLRTGVPGGSARRKRSIEPCLGFTTTGRRAPSSSGRSAQESE